MSVIDKRVLGVARVALKRYLKQQEDEPLGHKMGPPDVGFSPEYSGVSRDLVSKFWEVMVKEGVVVVHPFGGWMHPRFVVAPVPSIESVREEVRKRLDGGVNHGD